MTDDSEFVGKEPCPKCGSLDNLARYDDGHAFCFTPGCEHYEKGEGEPTTTSTRKTRMAHDLLEAGEFKALTKRGINEETCRKFGYSVGRFKDQPVQIAAYRDADGNVCAQKIRFPDKDFKFLGDSKSAQLFGQHLWRDGGKMVVITEGEIDALSISQLQGNKWPVVSIPNGAGGAKKSLSKQIDWLENFDHIILMFDMDEPGQTAAKECALLFTPGKAKIANLPLKDANECLQANRGREALDAIWNAKAYRPEGIVTLSDLKGEVLKPTVMGLPWWSETLTALTYGRRNGEIYCFGAGTGVGKTDWLTQQIQHDTVELDQKVALFFLEQQPVETAKRVAGKVAGQRFHIPDAGWTQDQLIETIEKLEAGGKLFLFDHFGTADWEIIEKRIRYLAHSEGVKLFYIDHLTALAAAEESEKEGLEQIMAGMGGLVKELDIIIHLVSHLSTPEGKPHEEGGRVMIRHFKGSRAIGFWSHFMFGLERNQQAEDEVERQTTTFRVLKDRYTGQATGQTIRLGYDQAQGRLFEKGDEGFGDETGSF